MANNGVRDGGGSLAETASGKLGGSGGNEANYSREPDSRRPARERMRKRGLRLARKNRKQCQQTGSGEQRQGAVSGNCVRERGTMAN